MRNDSSRKPASLTRRRPRQPLPLWRFALFGQLPLEHETCLFLLVNLADVVVTAWLTHAGSFREANRLAVWVLQHWGWYGLLAYKFGLVTVVCLVTQWIARHRLETARRLLQGATAVFALVLAVALALALVR